MKLFYKIFYTLMMIILLLCTGILICALTPSLTEMLAEKVENSGIAQSGGSGRTAESLSGDNEGQSKTVKVQDGTAADVHGSQPDEGQPGINPDWMKDADRAGYEPPDSQSIQAPVSVSGRTGYEPVQEEAEQILPEEAENLVQNAPVGNTGSDLSFDSEYYPYYAMLETNLRQLYSQIYANAMDGMKSFSPVTAVNVNQVKTVFEAVYNDHPELFWLETGYSCKYLRSGSCVEITLKYNSAADNLEQAKQDFESRAGEILSAAQAYTSDPDKEQFVHDSLMQSVEYVLNAPMNQSAYSALVQGQSVCAGYARAFQYLCQQLGIPCYYCTGYAGEDHAWNIVKLGEDYYNVDVTWDDTDPSTYDYFNKGDREFGTTHARTGLAVYLPACLSGPDASDLSEQQPDLGTAANEDGGNGKTGNPDSSETGQAVAGEGQENPQEKEEVWINPNPMEPLTWQGRAGEVLDTEPEDEEDGQDTESAEEERRQEALEKAGITAEDVLDTLEAYYEDCETLLKTLGTGNCQFSNVIPEELWDSIERAYNSGDYRTGYVDDALEALNADSFMIHLQVQDLGGGYWRLYHNVYTY